MKEPSRGAVGTSVAEEEAHAAAEHRRVKAERALNDYCLLTQGVLSTRMSPASLRLQLMKCREHEAMASARRWGRTMSHVGTVCTGLSEATEATTRLFNERGWMCATSSKAEHLYIAITSKGVTRLGSIMQTPAQVIKF
eukprot:jgi/Mesvir1/6990/Mv24248-RA.1